MCLILIPHKRTKEGYILVSYHSQLAGALFFILVFCFNLSNWRYFIYVGRTQPISYNDWQLCSESSINTSKFSFQVINQILHAVASLCMQKIPYNRKRQRKLHLKKCLVLIGKRRITYDESSLRKWRVSFLPFHFFFHIYLLETTQNWTN